MLIYPHSETTFPGYIYKLLLKVNSNWQQLVKLPNQKRNTHLLVYLCVPAFSLDHSLFLESMPKSSFTKLEPDSDDKIWKLSNLHPFSGLFEVAKQSP